MAQLTFKKAKSKYCDGTIVNVYNKRKEKLGWISYYKKWKKWIWEQELCIMMSVSCLEEVAEYIKNIKS